MILLISACSTEYSPEYEVAVKDEIVEMRNNSTTFTAAEISEMFLPIISFSIDNNPKRDSILLNNEQLVILLLSMTIHETNYLKSGLVSCENVLGIKKLKLRPSISLKTFEYNNNVKTTELAEFACFYSFADCYHNWITMITSNKKYEDFCKAETLPNAIFELAEIYATDPEYNSHIRGYAITISELFNLSKLMK